MELGTTDVIKLMLGTNQVWANSVPFAPTGMTKNASTQAWTGGSAVQVTGLVAEASSTVTSNALVNKGGTSKAMISGQVYISTTNFMSNITLEVRKNGTLLPGSSITVDTTSSATITITIDPVIATVTDGDQFTLWVTPGSTIGGTIGAGVNTFLRVSLPVPIMGRGGNAPRTGATAGTTTTSTYVNNPYGIVAGDYKIVVIITSGSALHPTRPEYTAHLLNYVATTGRRISIYGQFISAAEVTAGGNSFQWTSGTGSNQWWTFYVRGDTIDPSTPIASRTERMLNSTGSAITTNTTTTPVNNCLVLNMSMFVRANTTATTTTWTGGAIEINDYASNLTSGNTNWSAATAVIPTAGLVPTYTSTPNSSVAYRYITSLVIPPVNQ